MAASPPSQYLLRWKDHLSNYGDIFLSLREQEEFVDCSIACEDGIVGAHRVVLAGCSSYLRDLFARVSNPHPVIFLISASRSLVLMLMEFIYRGQVHVPQHRLQQLLALGQALKIKGLTQMVPVAGSSSNTGISQSSITSLFYSSGLPLIAISSLPFTATTDNTDNPDTSDPSDTQEHQATEEENSENTAGEEEKEDREQEKTFISSRPKQRRQQKQKRSTKSHRRSTKKSLTKEKELGEPLDNKKKALRMYHNVKERERLGSYALEHGIAATRRYVRETYSIRIRESTIERLIMFHKRSQAKKNAKAANTKTKREAVQKHRSHK